MRRIASDNEGVSSWRAAQASIRVRNSGGMRTPTKGSWPVAGLPRPLVLCLTDIDFVIKLFNIKSRTKERRIEEPKRKRPRGGADRAHRVQERRGNPEAVTPDERPYMGRLSGATGQAGRQGGQTP